MLKQASETEVSAGGLKGILAFNVEPLVSMDFNHTTVSSSYDSTQLGHGNAGQGAVLV
ncbi:MAG: hypothetical protein R3E08_02200 [Thiotrichaceae bacterium]